jgi:thioredoxin-like negative regulator of GroEL
LTNTDKFEELLARAEQEQDWGRALLMGQALCRNGPPGAEPGLRLARALAGAGRPGEGLALLGDLAASAGGDPALALTLARALAGAGRTDEAVRVLDACPASLAEPAGKRLRKQAQTARKLARQLGHAPDWRTLKQLVAMLVHLGADEAAALAVRRFLAAQPPLPEDPEDALALVRDALATIEPEQVFPLLRDLLAILPKSDGRRLIKAAARAVSGADLAGAGWDEADIGRGDRGVRFLAALALLAAGRRTEALTLLSQIAERHKRDLEVRMALACAVGEEVLAGAPVRYRAGGRQQIVSVLMLNNEHEMLRLKLAEEGAWVDRFVIVEASHTFTGLPKPLHFEQWKGEFADYADRITHVKVERFPDWAQTAWARDFYQRDMAVRGASGLWGVDDLVLVTDADEIVDRRALEGFDGEYASMRMETFRFFLNHHLTHGRQATGVVFRAKYFQKFGLSCARFVLRSSSLLPVLDNCGWHFTSVADPDVIAAKVRSFAHQENKRRTPAEYERMFAKIRAGKLDPDYWERWPIDERFPAYIRENGDRLSNLILPEEVAEPV